MRLSTDCVCIKLLTPKKGKHRMNATKLLVVVALAITPLMASKEAINRLDESAAVFSEVMANCITPNSCFSLETATL